MRKLLWFRIYISSLITFLFLFLFTTPSYSKGTFTGEIIAVQRQPTTERLPGQLFHHDVPHSIIKVNFSQNKAPKISLLTPEFYSAKDPAVSFDGEIIFFAGQKEKSDHFQIYRMKKDGSEKVQLTHEKNDHFQPLEVGTLFYLNDKTPTPQIIYTQITQTSPPIYALVAANSDGLKPRQISHNVFSDIDPDVLPNGRLVFSSFSDKVRNGIPTAQLMAVNIDGTDLMPVSGDQDPGQNHLMPRVGYDSKIYYIETNNRNNLHGGDIATVDSMRPLHTRQRVTEGGLYCYPCPLPDGSLLVSQRGSGRNYNIVQIEPGKSFYNLFQIPNSDVIDVQLLQPHPEAKGRSSVVGFRHKNTGVFFCMNVYMSDRPEIQKLQPGSVKEVLITEGVAQNSKKLKEQTPVLSAKGLVGSHFYLHHRIIGKVAVEKDGSFHVRVPSETPVTFHLLDENGKILASQKSWTWVMHGESRGCIGCHEDRELSPPNIFIDAVKKPPVKLVPPVEKRDPIQIGDDI